MRVFLTGATGLVGFHTAAALLEAGHSVCALVRDPEKGARVLGRLAGEGMIPRWVPALLSRRLAALTGGD